MKKWISVIIIICVLAALVIFEPLYISKAFGELEQKSIFLIHTLSENKENIDTQSNIDLCKELDKYWDNQKRTLQLFHNQLILNDFEMKLARLLAAVTANEYPMALTELEQIYRSACEQQRLAKPSVSNIL